MHSPVSIIDAFADVPFQGNPAGVCILDEPIPEDLMQSIAMELNHSETAFVTPGQSGIHHLRWFTPTSEVDLCGHATLAAAHALWEKGHAEPTITFSTASGELICRKQGANIEMDFPSEFHQPVRDYSELAHALGSKPDYVGENRLFWLVELESETAVRTLQPNMEAISRLPLGGIVVTAQSDTPADDFVSRVFAPSLGIPEDPVTGSAHCLLAPYWSKKLDKMDMVGYQASKRGGVVRVSFRGARTLLSGRAQTTLVGTILLPPR